MTRVKGGIVSKNRRRKVLKRAKGYFGSKHRLYKTAQEQLFHSGAYSFNDRKKRANDFRKLWITRINAACRSNEIVYSKFINGLKKANIEINRKMLSEVAIDNPKAFTSLVELAKSGKVKETKKTVEKSTKEVKKVKETKEEKKDYSKMTVAELKNLAKEKNITGYTTMKKAELVAALEK